MGSVIPALLSLFLLTGCATDGVRPLTPKQLGRLADKSLTAKEAGIDVTRNPKAGVVLGNVRQVPLGSRTLVPLLESRSREGTKAPLVRIAINDRVSHALIDTGSTQSLIDYPGAARVNLNPLSGSSSISAKSPANLLRHNTIGLGGEQDFVLALAHSVTVGSLKMYKVPVGIVNDQRGLLGVGWLKGQRVEAILGHDLLMAYKYVTIDFPNELVRLNASGTYRPDPEKVLATAPLYVRNGLPAIPAKIEGAGPVLVALDTGGDFGLWIPYTVGMKLKLPDLSDPSGIKELKSGVGMGGRTAYKDAGPYTVDLGGFEIRDVPAKLSVIRPDLQDPPFAFVGTRILSRYAVTLDYKAKKIYFEKP